MEGKEEVILKIALELFLEKGYENTNLKDIIDKVGGSYTTIYKKFKNKHQLFLRALKYGADERIKVLTSLVGKNKHLDLVNFLDNFAFDYFTYFCSEYNVNFVRLVISRSYRDKILQKLLNESDKTEIIKHLASAFEEKLNKDIFKEIDSLSLANIYCSMIRTDKMFSIFANMDIERISEENIRNHVKSVNKLFLRAINFNV